MLERFERYLPMLKLKQQQLQLTIRQVASRRDTALQAVAQARQKLQPYRGVLSDVAGVDVRRLARPQEVKTSRLNVAGITVPIFDGVDFPAAEYSLFSTPPWVDRTLADLREISRNQAEADVLNEQYEILHHELTKIVQRVNLFEKVKIPESREAIRIIRIKLGDEMTAAVGRAKIAKNKLLQGHGETCLVPPDLETA